MMLRPALLVVALAASSFAWGEAYDPPERIARLGYVEGQVAFQPAQEPAPSALPDRPLMPGDRLVTERGGRAEVTLGTAAIRLGEHTELTLVDLRENTVWLELNRGTASVIVHDLLEGEMLEIVTPNTAITLQEPGEYRVDVSEDGSTAIMVHGGAAEVQSGNGPVRVADGQRVQLEGRDAFATLTTPLPDDAFDRWVLAREQQLADAESQYAMRDGDEYEELDDYGEWYDEPSYGRVWMPSYAYGGWSPFSYGRWERVGYGYGWVNPLPWSSFTFFYGRWTFLDHLNRWCWVPERSIRDRHFAFDTKPFGRPRDDARSRDDRSDRVRDVIWRTRDEGITRAPAFSDTDHRQADNDSGSTLRRKGATNYLPSRDTPVRTGSRDRDPPRRATASGGGEATMHPSGSSTTRSQASSRTTSPSSSKYGSRYSPP